MFDVEITKHIKFNNYIAKQPIIDNRIFLNGNRLFFIEPMEANTSWVHKKWVRHCMDVMFYDQMTVKEACESIKLKINQIQNFLIWHYQYGSKYDTPFWDYAKTFTFEDSVFNSFYEHALKHDAAYCRPTFVGGMTDDLVDGYSCWEAYSFRNWIEGMGL